MTYTLKTYAAFMVTAWLTVMLLHLGQWITTPTDYAWAAKLIVKNVSEAVIWTGASVWVCYVQMGRSKLWAHIAIVATACFIDEAVLAVLMPWLFFALGWPWPAGAFQLVWAAFFALTVLVQIKVCLENPGAKTIQLWAIASGIGLALASIQTWAEHNDTESLNRLPYESNIYPAVLITTPRPSLEDGLKELWGKKW